MSEHVAGKVELLHATLRGLADAIVGAGPDSSVRLTETETEGGKVKLIAAPLDALDVPESLTVLRARVAGMLPRVDLPEILLEVHTWTGFLHAYTHVSGPVPEWATCRSRSRRS